jgi:hypothetical protein
VTAGPNFGGAQQIQDRAVARGQDGSEQKDQLSLFRGPSDDASEQAKQRTDLLEQTLRQRSRLNWPLTGPQLTSATLPSSAVPSPINLSGSSDSRYRPHGSSLAEGSVHLGVYPNSTDNRPLASV